MKNLNFLFIGIVLLTCNFVNAQDDAAVEKEIAEFHQPYKTKFESILALTKQNQLEIETVKDSVKLQQLLLKGDSLINEIDKNRINELNQEFKFAKEHPNSIKSLEMIRIRVGRFEGMNYYDTFEEVFQNFSPEIKNSEKGKEMAEKLKYFKQSKVGSPAPNFILKDSNDKTISLADFKNKEYILIDFWASWCAPCLEELPYIKELYKKYQHQGFEIISITEDKESDSWKNAIIKNKIESWKHISLLENQSKIDKEYFVNGIPHKVLIDKNGIIIGKWKGTSENNKRDLQQLLKSIFEAE
ncbi:TlpA family protein disulfide reductase [Flavobacterium johnsoniae]|uniref:Thioredoxin domain-containing protein n=1 Tax=Flavobacterium johnsoniae TaxID=986 RepID=A0A1J7BLW7_FLAJO|nr:TlpA disulfide reductase family protein [Flavobacterium johnsoniae]OIV39691.1 hypothetical protein BKM63_22785 [Flavobacterium johnsoniae]